MIPFYTFFKRLWLLQPRRGQTLVEYALILAIISIVAIGVFAQLGQEIVRVFSAIDTLLDTATASH